MNKSIQVECFIPLLDCDGPKMMLSVSSITITRALLDASGGRK